MRNKLISSIAFLFCFGFVQINYAQNVGINTTGVSPDNSAMLDIVSPDKGLLIPRMDSTSRKNIVTPAEGLMVFDSTYNNFYFYDGTSWTSIGGANTDSQNLNLNNDSLFLTNDPTPVDLSAYLDNTDTQNLSIANDTLTITNGQSPIDLKPYKDADNLGNHTATQNVQLGDNWLGNDGENSEGILIDASGNVGIGVFPDNIFRVSMGTKPLSAMVSQTQSGSIYNGSPGASIWQSFTATSDAVLSQIHFGANTGAFGWSCALYEGEGTGGQWLATGTWPVGFNAHFIFNDVPLRKNQKYTVVLYFSNFSSLLSNTTNPYSSGRSSVGENYDFWFQVFASDYKTGFNISETSIVFNDYAFPVIDGTANQVLVTDGSGALSWVEKTLNTDAQQLTISNDSLFLTNDTTAISLSPYLDNTDYQQLTISNDSLFLTNDTTAISLSPYLDNTDNQQLTISNDSLFLTNGGTPINLDPYLDADNLGNHTATQNLIIAGNAIQNNSSSTNGLTMGAENQLLVESGANRSGHFTTTGINNLGDPFGGYLEVNNHSGTRSIFGADGSGLYSTDSLNTVLGNWTTGGGITFHVSGGTKVMTLGNFGRLGIGRIATTNLLEVEGDASKTTAGNWLANSDARLKKNITSLSSNDMLNKLLSLNGVTYEWNDNKTNTKRPEGIQYGFTAQNIQEVFPSLVTEDNNGFLQTPYGTYDAMTVEAIRALNDKIEKQALKIDELNTLSRSLKEENEALKTQSARIDQLESMVEKLTSELN